MTTTSILPAANTIIRVNVVGTDPKTRAYKPFNATFDGAGNLIGTSHEVIEPAKLPLTIAQQGEAPAFPIAEYVQAQATKDFAREKAILKAHQEAVEAYENASGGGSVELQIAKWALEYLTTFEGFLSTDGAGFVVKLDNLQVTRSTAGDLTIYSVAGTAVFG